MKPENKKCKLRLKDVSKPNEPFGIHSLDKFREVGSYTWIAEKITTEMGFPNSVKGTDDCHCCEGQLFVLRHGTEDRDQSIDSFGQVLTMINHETGNTNIFTRVLHPVQNNGEWSLWQMVATGDPKLIEENNNINEALTILRKQIEDNSKRIDATESSFLVDTTLRLNCIEEKKMDIVNESDSLYIKDYSGYIIAKIDKDGVHSIDYSSSEGKLSDVIKNIRGSINTETARAESAEQNLRDSKLDKEIQSDSIVITDARGYIIAKIDKDGVHSINNKLNANKVAAMVLGEMYIPTAVIYGSDMNVDQVSVIFYSGENGEITFTREEDMIVKAEVLINGTTYNVIINRDEQNNIINVISEQL